MEATGTGRIRVGEGTGVKFVDYERPAVTMVRAGAVTTAIAVAIIVATVMAGAGGVAVIGWVAAALAVLLAAVMYYGAWQYATGRRTVADARRAQQTAPRRQAGGGDRSVILAAGAVMLVLAAAGALVHGSTGTGLIAFAVAGFAALLARTAWRRRRSGPLPPPR